MNAVHAEGLAASANSAFMYGIGAAVAALITLVSIVFAVRSSRAAVAAGIDKKKIRSVIRSSAVFTLIPSTAILLGLVTMAGGLGVPLSWIRLSVIGAVQYELIAANAAASAAGIPALLLVPLTPLLSSPVLAPAFVNVIPAQTAQTVSGALIPVSVLVTVAGARILYKRNMV